MAQANQGARARLGASLRAMTGAAPKQEAPQAQNEIDIITLTPPQKLEDLYQFDMKLYDAGDRSKVFAAKERSTGKDVIVKVRKKGFFSGGERVWRNVLTRIMNIEKSDNVLGIDTILEDEKGYYVVMQKCGGGELFDFLLNETDVPERECKRIMREILRAVDHLHSQGLIHRDIKPENVLFTTNKEQQPEGPRNLKLIDFDTCQDWTPKSPKAQRIVGTPGYIAPESFRGDYTPASDLWSVGVILYILMTGDMPFPEDVFGDDIAGNNQVGGGKMEQIYKRLKTFKIDFECPPWPDFPQARDLCSQLLAFDPGDRSPSAADALQHPWLKE
mmetsp:Transcript_6651/g.16315  ORF Transcript_6651/g.16315 Transcript_6651/m.16315 type:complete len:331 (+) Transcript_6651:187-1179(+)|eukprot:CAMPEP_0178990260 /NCGR_PEP_ID=MMETSP0795-20121207/4835_1 /TAXON_ID=88552 /ORGANISM="Amoebophrya sp., Strain Ameob2" /LENGTH=330 /DNA_ID=CAMNT_0020681761 /DNA_START=121 /DNA_END=1113 /DNA_ORIENTATION=+